MSNEPPKIVTAFTLPPALLRDLAAEAVRQDRSRSWITAEAIKQYLSRRESDQT